MSNFEQQRQLEDTYRRQQTFFYQSISAKIAERLEEIPKILDGIILKKQLDAEDQILSLKEFETLGSLCYISGIDFLNSVQISELVLENVKKRFDASGITPEICQSFVNALSVIDGMNFEVPKSKLKDGYVKSIKIENSEIEDFNLIRAYSKAVINSSILPISMSVGVNEILQKQKDLTYEDILKINSLINMQCAFIGGTAISNLMKLNAIPLYRELIGRSAKRFDDQKFAVVYLDGVISAIEKIKAIGAEKFLAVINGTVEADEAPVVTEQAPVQISEEKIEEVKEQVEGGVYVTAPEAYMKQLNTENPIQFVNEILYDLNGGWFTTAEEFATILDKLLEDQDLNGFLYQYMKSKLTVMPTSVTIDPIDYEGVIASMKEKSLTLGLEYKAITEGVCKEIPAPSLKQLTELLKNVIESIILKTNDQKQYLVSQLMENQISTYQQLNQTMGLIESCDIIGKDSINYVLLSTFLESDENLKEIFENSEKIPVIEQKLAWYLLVDQWFSTCIPPVETEEPIQTGSPVE